MMICIIILLTCGTINCAATIKLGVNGFVFNGDFPGGPAAYIMEQTATTTGAIGNCAYVTASIIADGILVSVSVQ